MARVRPDTCRDASEFADLVPDALRDLIAEATEAVRNDMWETFDRTRMKDS